MEICEQYGVRGDKPLEVPGMNDRDRGRARKVIQELIHLFYLQASAVAVPPFSPQILKLLVLRWVVGLVARTSRKRMTVV